MPLADKLIFSGGSVPAKPAEEAQEKPKRAGLGFEAYLGRVFADREHRLLGEPTDAEFAELTRKRREALRKQKLTAQEQKQQRQPRTHGMSSRPTGQLIRLSVSRGIRYPTI
ncbi:hypothetical protein Pan181_18910 [Aeoliella mucimassa]|uniref:Uncharacterized protein n=1 Tax=Aeoliella mucimassa TaxID=2527972 RepID=A0A518ALU7_9BACT|nr:hypothetical protein Pan181_18910 [Aeoliella mucimassa]